MSQGTNVLGNQCPRTKVNRLKQSILHILSEEIPADQFLAFLISLSVLSLLYIMIEMLMLGLFGWKKGFQTAEISKVKTRYVAHVTCCEGRRKNIGRQGKIIRVNTFKTVVRHLVTHLLTSASCPPLATPLILRTCVLPPEESTKYPKHFNR